MITEPAARFGTRASTANLFTERTRRCSRWPIRALSNRTRELFSCGDALADLSGYGPLHEPFTSCPILLRDLSESASRYYNRYSDADAGPFETDPRYVHQEYRLDPEYNGDVRGKPDQRMRRPARLLELPPDGTVLARIGHASDLKRKPGGWLDLKFIQSHRPFPRLLGPSNDPGVTLRHRCTQVRVWGARPRNTDVPTRPAQGEQREFVARGIDAEGIVGPAPRPWKTSLPLSGSGHLASAFTATVATRAAPFTVRGREFEWWAKRKRAHHSVDMRVGGRRKGAFAHPTGWFA
ncbi:hypothetical protein ABIA94_009363 [Bradyrhizobium sp. LA7.1]